MRIVKIGDRVSGTVLGQDYTGTVDNVHGRGGRYARDADGALVEVEPSTPEAVHIASDVPLTTPAGRTVHGVLLRGPEEIGTLTFLDEAAEPGADAGSAVAEISR
ncbi:hypothetical protein [Streptomyces sp. NPDC020983]|uniref:hypothetical protein n=1 Tax=Streptomyces sp. NPDC020983 TaxID=3365106 RepID=UPI00379F753B